MYMCYIFRSFEGGFDVSLEILGSFTTFPPESIHIIPTKPPSSFQIVAQVKDTTADQPQEFDLLYSTYAFGGWISVNWTACPKAA